MIRGEAFEDMKEILNEKKQAMEVSACTYKLKQTYHLQYIACTELTKEEIEFINYASEYAMNEQFEFVTSNPKTVQLYFSTFHMSQYLLKSRIIQDENFARLLVVSCLILVTKLISPELISRLNEAAKKNQINMEVATIFESYILNLVDWKLHITTPDNLAADLISLLLTEECIEDQWKISVEFNKIFQYVIANFESYKDYNQFIWTLVVLQHSLITHDMIEESEALNEIIATLISSEQESEDLANCFDLLTLILEKSEVSQCITEMEELNLENNDLLLLHLNSKMDDDLPKDYNCISHSQLNIDLLAKFNKLGKKDSMQVNDDYLNTSNYNTITKASDKDNYESTGSLTTINLNSSSLHTRLQTATNLELTAKTWNCTAIDIVNDNSNQDFVTPTILNAMKRRCSLKTISEGNLG